MGEAVTIDDRFEFDAPRYHDFLTKSPAGTDEWFDRLDGSESMAMDSEVEQAGSAMDIDESSHPDRAATFEAPSSSSSQTSGSRDATENKEALNGPQEPGKLVEISKRPGFITPRRPKELPNPILHARRKAAGDFAKRIRVDEDVEIEPSKKQRMGADCHAEISFVQGKHSKGQDASEPMPPKLATSRRARPPRYKGRAQIEEEEMAAMPKFKAQPIRAPLSKPRAASVPLLNVKSNGSCTLEEQNFARPTASSRQHGLQQDSQTNPEVPGSSTFVFKAKGQLPGRHSLGVTQPKPFNLQTDIRGGRAKERMCEPQSQSGEAKSAGFHAQLTPRSTYRVAPMQPKNPVFTMPEPFNLQSEKRHEQACELAELKAQQEEERRREEAHFKARLTPRGAPFKPAKSETLLTVPDDVILHGDVRSKHRAEFDAAMAEKEQRLKDEAAVAEAEKRAREEEEIKQLRKNLQFKARPMPVYKTKSWEFKLPPPQWTEPQGPSLATDARAAARATNRDSLRRQSTL